MLFSQAKASQPFNSFLFLYKSTVTLITQVKLAKAQVQIRTTENNIK